MEKILVTKEQDGILTLTQRAAIDEAELCTLEVSGYQRDTGACLIKMYDNLSSDVLGRTVDVNIVLLKEDIELLIEKLQDIIK